MVANAGRRLSPMRVGVAVAVLAGGGWLAVDGATDALSDDGSIAAPSDGTWFAPYVDVTIEPATAFEDPAVARVDDLVLSFVVADPERPCRPTWGGAYSLDDAGTDLELDRRIARVRQRQGQVVVAFGGAANDELATACEDVADLTDAYRAVVDRYEVDVVDIDVEGDDLADAAAAGRRAEALAALQADRPGDDPLAVWLTLPVSPAGLPDEALAVVEATLAGGVDLAGVNAMTMNYGESRGDRSMLDASVAALEATHGQVADAFADAGVALDDAAVWARLGATPMLGQNDVTSDRFELDDAVGLLEVARDRGLGRLSVWSLNRDLPCGPNDTGSSSPLCSGTDAEVGAFTDVLGTVGGRLPVVGDDPEVVAAGRAEPAVDDPATSPHPIWESSAAYAEGERVVWRRNVYEAKWWNQDEAPDTPVAEAWETPWRLLGPVLPGDRPAPVERLPVGTHPAWDPDVVYHAGDRVLLDGIAYRAKWWTSGDAPDAQVDPFASPWEQLPAD